MLANLSYFAAVFLFQVLRIGRLCRTDKDCERGAWDQQSHGTVPSSHMHTRNQVTQVTGEFVSKRTFWGAGPWLVSINQSISIFICVAPIHNMFSWHFPICAGLHHTLFINVFTETQHFPLEKALGVSGVVETAF